MANLTSFKNIGIFTNQLAYPCKSDPFKDISDIIFTDGLISGDSIRISTFKMTKDGIKEDKLLILVTVP